MKSKKTVYILIPVVLVIWGYIGFKIFSYGENEEDIQPIRVAEIITGKEEKPASKMLALNYADPFLKGTGSRKISKGAEKVKRPKPQKAISVEWGSIIYNGFVKNQKNTTKIALLNINGSQSLAGKGDEVQQIVILSIEQDSVLLEKENDRKWFRKFNQSSK